MPALTPPPTTPAHEGTILVVDDNANNLNLLCALLQSVGYKVRPALSGPQALKALELSLPDLILLGIRMPVMDGLEVCRQLKHNAHTRDIPVIFISANQDSADRVAAFHAGGVDYVIKPFFEQEVLARVHTHIQLWRSRRHLQALAQAGKDQLAQTEERLALTLSNAEIGAWDWDIANGRMVFDLLWGSQRGYPPEPDGFQAQPWRSGIAPEDLALARRSLAQHLEGYTAAFSLEYRVHINGDGWGWILLRGAVTQRDATGKPLRMLGIEMDISERKRAEQALVDARHEADRANRVKSEFLARMSDEFRAPLNSVLSHAHLLSNDPDLSDEKRAQIHEIERDGATLMNFVSDVLNLSHIGAAPLKLAREPMVVGSLTQSCFQIMSATARAAGIELIDGGGNGVQATILANPRRLQQVLLTFLSNAIQYNRPHGSVRLAYTLRHGAVRIEVSDTGPGLTQEKRAHIFDAFDRLSLQRQGGGVGLSLARSIVLAMGGNIGCDSVEGLGCTFWTEFSLHSPVEIPHHKIYEEDSTTAPAVIAADEPRPRVLIIDDTPVNLLVLQEALSKEFDLQTATSGKAGLTLAAQWLPDVILLDVMMPEMDGFETCRHLKADPQLASIAVVFVTARNEIEVESTGLGLGAADFITKPVTLGIARQRIRNLVERSRLNRKVAQNQHMLENMVQEKTIALQLSVDRTRRALAELEQQKFVLDHHAIVTMTDTKGHITYGNRRFCEISGYAPEEFMGRDHHLLNSGHHPKGFFKAMYASVAKGGVWHAEVCNRAKNGQLYWVDTTVAAFMGADGRPREYIAVRTDITAAKESQLQLKNVAASLGDSARFLARAGRIAGIGRWQLDLTQNLLSWSDQTYVIHDIAPGHTPTLDEVIALYEPDVRGEMQAAMDAARQSGQPWDLELPLVTAQGRRKWIRNAGEVEYRDGNKVLLVGIVQDVTRRRQLKEEIRKNNALMKSILEHIPVGLSVFDGDLNLVLYNPLFRRLFDFPDSLFTGSATSLEALVRFNADRGEYGEKNSEAMVQSILKHARLGQPNKLRRRRRNGRTLEISSVPLPMGGLATTYTDITELTDATEAARHASLAKSQFLANMSHEIRTPLNGVLGMLEILQETELKDEQQRMVETIQNSSLALFSLLNDILDFSKIEADRLELEQVPTALRDEVENVVRLMVSVARAKAVDIELFVDPALPAWVKSDPTRLRQILFNLIGNALKFIERDVGTVSLQVRLANDQDGNNVQFCIRDNGIGMSEEVLALVFQPFTQADASTARKFGGTGLGLSITQRLVQLMKGQIKVQSTSGAGTEFTVALPLIECAAPGTPAQVTLPDLNGVGVFFLSHSTARRLMVESYLASVGARVSVLSELPSPDALASDDKVLLLDELDKDCAAASRQLPSLPGVLVVRLVRRGEMEPDAPDIEVPSCPLFYRDLIGAVALACQRTNVAASARPVERRSSPRPEAPSVAQALQRHQLILLAEDNETNRDVMQAQLRLLGYAAEVAEDGAQALQMWRSGRYALLLTDCHMPHMDGFELTQAIRQQEPAGTHLPIVAITANAMQGEAQRCRQRGMDDYLSKPLRLKELAPVLHKWLPLAHAMPLTPDAQAPHSEAYSPQKSALVRWDASTLRELVGDNPSLHQRVCRAWHESSRVKVPVPGL